MNKGLLLINLGTTEAPTPRETGKYLSEFLMDPLVIDIPYLWRWILVHLLIVPRRRHSSSKAYQKIWMESGSPLLVLSQQLREALQLQLVDEFQVSLGMRYGKPDLKQSLHELRNSGVEELFVLPLYPHFADSSTTTALVRVNEILRQMNWFPRKVLALDHFFWFSGYQEAMVELIATDIAHFHPDHLLFSYHGLPQRHLYQRKDLQMVCRFSEECCSEWTDRNQLCYRAQCFATSRLVDQGLRRRAINISTSTAFQSRLGRTPWILPSIEEEMARLAENGVKRLLVTCPSFVIDCLETLEEVQMRMRSLFLSLGGEDLGLVSSLNSHPSWVKGLAQLATSDKWLALSDLLEMIRK